MEYRTLEIEREGEVLRVWLNRPHRRNAVDQTMLREVGDLFRSLESDFDTRVVVLGGRGKSFCSGADRKPPEAMMGVSGSAARTCRTASAVGIPQSTNLAARSACFCSVARCIST